jgi:hypothetical protein
MVGYDLWYFENSAEFGESIPLSNIVVPLSPETVIYKAVYLPAAQATVAGVNQAQSWLQVTGNVRFLRLIHSSDGAPFRSALIYTSAGATEVARVRDPRIPPGHQPESYRSFVLRYQAVRGASGSSWAWVSDAARGEVGFFLTGSSGVSALWRIARIETDALDRQVLTLAPVQLAHGVANADFSAVSDGRLRAHLETHYAAFLRAVAAAAHLDVIDRAFNVAEGVLEHRLHEGGIEVPSTLNERIVEARKAIRSRRLGMSTYGCTLADKIRELHRQSHADQAVARGRLVRPEIGMTVAADLSELLVDAGLGRY